MVAAMSTAFVFSLAEPSVFLNSRNTNGNSNSKRLPSHQRIMVSPATPAKRLFSYHKKLHRRMDYLISTGKVNIQTCKDIQNDISNVGLQQSVYLGSKLISMYAICGSVEDALQVFDELTERDVFVWTALIGGYARNGLYEEALRLYFDMKSQGILPTHFTFSYALTACAAMSALEMGRDIHAYIIKHGFLSNTVLGTALVRMYASCGRMEDARQVFDKMSAKNVVSWGTIISGFAQKGEAKEARKYFCRMLDEDVKPSPFIISSILPAIKDLKSLEQGKEIHCYVIKAHIDSNVFVQTALVSMYDQCKSFESARRVFDRISEREVSLWNTMILSYCKNGFANEAFELYRQMNQNSVKPYPETICFLLSTCSDLASLKQGKEIHCYVIRNYIESNEFVGSTLVAMYGHYKRLQTARKVFDRISARDAVLWNAVIAAHFQNGYGNEALELFCQMNQSAVKPYPHNISSLLPGYTDLSSLKQGKEIHCYVIRNNLETNEFLGSALVAMYSRFKRLEDARRVFDRIPERDVILWNAMITAYSQNGRATEALKLLLQVPHNAMKSFLVFISGISFCT